MTREAALPDVVVVGGGIVGVVLCTLLTRRGCKVTLIEQGGSDAVQAPAASLRVVGDSYRGATTGRLWGLGGNGRIWGGQLLPLTDDEMDGADSWPFSLAELEAATAEVERLFGVTPGTYEGGASPYAFPAIEAGRAVLRVSKWPPFRRRNVVGLVRPSPLLHTLLGYRATHFNRSGNRVRSVVATATTGDRIEVTGRTFIIAGGTFETTRLLLELARSGDFPSLTRSISLGAGFQEHLSAVVGIIPWPASERVWSRWGMYLDGQTLRTPRLHLPAAVRRDLGCTASFAQLVFRHEEFPPFLSLRNALRQLQAHRLAWNELGGLIQPAALAYLPRLALSALLRKRVLPPPRSRVHLVVDIAQPAADSNRLDLDSTRNDLVLKWRISPEDRAMLGRAANHLATTVEGAFGVQLERIRAHNFEISDTYHPSGTTRMSISAETGVVDPQLRLHGTDNLYCVSASTFPEPGAANPTLTLLALAAQVCDRVAHRDRDG